VHGNFGHQGITIRRQREEFHMLTQSLKRFERAVILILIAMMILIIILAVFELGWLLIQDIITPPLFLLEIDELLDIFGFFLLILIGVELLETIKAYLSEHVVHIEIVLEMGLIALARKVITLDLKDYPSLTIVAVGVLILSLALAFFLEKRARHL